MDIYVDVRAGRDGNGSKEMPFRRINEAAKVAKPGDTVLVAPGVYREYVDPIFAGEPDARITYKSTEPLSSSYYRSRAYHQLEALSGQCMGVPSAKQYLWCI